MLISMFPSYNGSPTPPTPPTPTGKVAIPSQSGELRFTGEEQSPTWSNYDSTKMTISGDTNGTNVGTYTATFTLASGYTWTDDTTEPKQVQWSILQAIGYIEVSPTSATLTPTQSTQVIDVIHVPGQIGVFPADTSIVTATIQYPPETGSGIQITLTRVGAGETTVSIEGAGTSYETGAIMNFPVTCTAKETPTLVLGKNTSTITGAAGTTDSTIITTNSDGALSATSSDTSVVTAQIKTVQGNNRTIKTVELTSVATGTATVTVSVAETSTYAQTSATISVDVTVQGISIWGVDWNGTARKGTRTDSAANFTDPVPCLTSTGQGSSPFDNVGPWKNIKKADYTGSQSFRCIMIPKFWYKVTPHTNDNGIKIQIADGPAEGFRVSPAHADRDGNGERDYMFFGRLTTTSIANKNFDMPTVENLTSHYYKQAYITDWFARVTLWLLYLVEFADWSPDYTIGLGTAVGNSADDMWNSTYHTGTSAANKTTRGRVIYRWVDSPFSITKEVIEGLSCEYTSGDSALTFRYILQYPIYDVATAGTNYRYFGGPGAFPYDGYVTSWKNMLIDIDDIVEGNLIPNTLDSNNTSYKFGWNLNTETSRGQLVLDSNTGAYSIDGLIAMVSAHTASTKDNIQGEVRLAASPENGTYDMEEYNGVMYIYEK